MGSVKNINDSSKPSHYDDFLKNLLFKEEQTMIVFFGDHQPMIDKQFYSDILGEDITELSSVQNTRTYRIPYFIWANYDAEIEVPKEASINFLPGILIDAANITSKEWFTFTG